MVMSDAISDSLTSRSGARDGAAATGLAPAVEPGWMSAIYGASKRAGSGVAAVLGLWSFQLMAMVAIL